ncbi:hypothetical protein [Acinetobacter baumannii]|uniref:hypothetical protein n=1 Tax=Acinetobacter baumannii TaxID=470 RepID=UPI0004F57365|nr:hypothetical protein [Acinetobacter baumannii]MDC4147566.1 hypothetical protein [Acinetobacter baumannii]
MNTITYTQFIVSNLFIFVGYFLLFIAILSKKERERNLFIAVIWLIAIYFALSIVDAKVGIPFTNINFF